MYVYVCICMCVCVCIYIYIYYIIIYILGVARYMYSYRTVTVQASRFGAWAPRRIWQFTPNPEGGARSNATLFDNRQQKNSECQPWHRGAVLMFGSLYFILTKYQLAVKLAMLELMCCVCVCVCVCTLRRNHFNCFLIPAESTLNTYCLINNHCIKVCFYLCTLTMKTKRFYI